MTRFPDRRRAGILLGRALERHRGADALVLALPRGGVPVGYEVARAIDGELDVVVARKLGAPGQPELGVGAIAPGARVLDRELLAALGLREEDLALTEREERRELDRRERAYRPDGLRPRVEGRVVIVVDDGVATGGTARAALRSVRAQRPALLVFAAPVGPPEARAALAAESDEVVLLATPEPFQAVGLWYDEFAQTSDEEVLQLLAQARATRAWAPLRAEVRVADGATTLDGSLDVPADPIGLVIFAHGSGSSRFSPRNRFVAQALRERGLATLLLDLLTAEEEAQDERTREHRFDIGLLARRLVAAASWARRVPALATLPIGLFGSSTGGGAALVAAARLPDAVAAVVSRGGRPDLAGDALPDVRAPTLLLVGARDDAVIALNETARARMRASVELRLVPGATHLFEEPGALEHVAGEAADFLAHHLAPRAPGATREAR